MRLYIWGTGIRSKKVINALIKDLCNIQGFIDNDPDKQGSLYFDKPIVALKDIKDEQFDYIIVSVQKYLSILYQLEEAGIKREKVIVYFGKEDLERSGEFLFIDSKQWKIDYLEEKLEKLEDLLNIRTSNLKYEIIDLFHKNIITFPKIGSTDEAIRKIIEEGCSMIRFGDGEFEMMEGRYRAPFQKVEDGLQVGLQKIIRHEDPKLLIAIANNYGNLELYTEEVADGIRDYMKEDIRQEHWRFLMPDRIYYDAYMFKCYYPYKDKSGTKERVNKVKSIWYRRNVVIVEGDKTRTGYHNDLFDNVASLKRILCPTTNAFDKYDDILNEAKKISKQDLILTVLGPAGKVLSYDLFLEGYQVVDIGQIDMDYDWYVSNAKTRIPNPEKYISQLPAAEIIDIEDEEYNNQILADLS